MKVTVRPLDGPELGEGVDKLRTLVYPYFPLAHDVEWQSSIWRWLESHPLGSDMHRWCLVTEEGEVVGHLAATPQYYRINGRRVVAHTPTDYQVLPEYGFQALLLMRKFFRAVENYVACDMVPSVIAVESRMGGEEVGKLEYQAKLLNVARLPVPPVPAPIRRRLNLPEWTAPARGYTDLSGEVDAQSLLAPPPVRPRAPIPAPLKGLLNGGLAAVDEALGRAFGGGHAVEVLEGFDESFDALFEETARAVPCMAEKDAAFLRWRYGPGSPAAPVTVLGVREGGERLLGYAVLKVHTKGPDKGRDSILLDLATLPGRHDVARSLLQGTVRHLRKAGAHIIRYRFIESPTSPLPGALRRLGFFPRNDRRHTLLAKFADPVLQKVAVDPANWSYSIGDGEATFWVG